MSKKEKRRSLQSREVSISLWIVNAENEVERKGILGFEWMIYVYGPDLLNQVASNRKKVALQMVKKKLLQ